MQNELWGSVMIELKVDKFGRNKEQYTKHLSTTLDSCDCGRSKKHSDRVSNNCLSRRLMLAFKSYKLSEYCNLFDQEARSSLCPAGDEKDRTGLIHSTLFVSPGRPQSLTECRDQRGVPSEDASASLLPSHGIISRDVVETWSWGSGNDSNVRHQTDIKVWNYPCSNRERVEVCLVTECGGEASRMKLQLLACLSGRSCFHSTVWIPFCASGIPVDATLA